MDRKAVEAEILNLAGEILMGKADEKEIERITTLAKENDCIDILAREFNSLNQALKGAA